MRLKLSDLWRWDGTVDRGAYAFWGCLLFALKYNLDRAVAGFGFGRKWWVFDYVDSPAQMPLMSLKQGDLAFYATLLALALPFIYTGVGLTLRRLRSAGLPSGAVALFFAPVVNLVFFLVLCLLPERQEGPTEPARRPLAAFMPKSRVGAAALALLLVPLFGVVLTVLAVQGLSQYGLSLFVGLPFILGLLSVLIYGYHQPRGYGACLMVSLLSITLLGLGLLAFAVEGVVCLAMAWPIGAVLAALGGSVGYMIQAAPGGGRAAPQVTLVVLACFPGLLGAESLANRQPPLIPVTTSVEVDVPPEKVWPHVIAFSELPPPSEWLFQTGIAYPVRARILGSGVGAVRRCEFSTGPFVEPITVWQPPRRLAFDVTSQPPAMRELSPWGKIDAPHVDRFLVSEHGEFRLTALPGGRTRLEGTTWYRHRIWPVAYWQIWSDGILHEIHGRVLRHVKALAEGRASIRE